MSLIEALVGNAHLLAITGRNFSGRTEILKGVACGNGRPARGGVYVGPEVYNYISGLAATTGHELDLHRSGTSIPLLTHLEEEFGLAAVRDRNPFTLSGGEQALLALACAVVMRRDTIAIDCALEQLDHDLYDRVVGQLDTLAAATHSRVLLADNRLAEHERPHARLDTGAITSNPARGSVLEFKSLDSSSLPPVMVRPAGPLSVEALNFQYATGGFALRDISFTLEPGCLYVLDGANGSGKSTLAKLLSGVLRPTSGCIALNGKAQDFYGSPGQVVGYHFQNPDVQLFEMSVKAEVLSGAAGRRVQKDVRAWASFACGAFGLGGILSEHPLDLPFVMRKRVALASTLAMGTPWVILDEPTVGQDDNSVRSLAATLLNLCDIGAGVVIISHSNWFRSLLPVKHTMRLREGTLEDGEERATTPS